MNSKIHELSSEIPLPKFDIFSVPPTQGIIENDITTEHRPISVIDLNSFVQFEINTAADEYLDLEKLFLYVKVKVKKADDIVEESWKTIAGVNYFMHSMIKQLDMFIDGRLITSPTATYAYKAYFEALLGFPNTAKVSYLQAAGWDPRATFNQSDEPMIDGFSFDKYNEKEYYGRIHTDIVYQGKVLLGGCRLIIRLLFNDPKFYMNSTSNKPEIEIMDICLFAHRAKVNQAIVEAHEAALKISPAKYPLTFSKVKAFNIPSGMLDVSIDNVINGQLPKRIFIAFVENSAFNGDYTKNPFNFKHFNISSLSVHLNGNQYPPKPFAPDFAKGLCVRELMSIYEALDMLDGECMPMLDRAAYVKGNTIFGFNFTPDLSIGSGVTGYVSPIKYGSLRLNVRFTTAATETLTVLVYCEFDKILEIDINRTPYLDIF